LQTFNIWFMHLTHCLPVCITCAFVRSCLKLSVPAKHLITAYFSYLGSFEHLFDVPVGDTSAICHSVSHPPISTAHLSASMALSHSSQHKCNNCQQSACLPLHARLLLGLSRHDHIRPARP